MRLIGFGTLVLVGCQQTQLSQGVCIARDVLSLTPSHRFDPRSHHFLISMQLFNSIDSNSDGYVSSPEFIACANATRLYARVLITYFLCSHFPFFASFLLLIHFMFLCSCSASLPGGLRPALDRFATIDTKGLGVVRWGAGSHCDALDS